MVRILLILILLAVPCHAYDIIYLGSNPNDYGTILAMHGAYDNSENNASVPQSHKTNHVIVDESGTATHFLIRICTASSNSLPVGYAVYDSTGNGQSNPPADTPSVRGYQASYTFTQTGWYAFPFNNDDTLSVTQNEYWHISFMINEDEGYADPDACRITIGVDEPSKFFPHPDCSYNTPPGVGGTQTYAQYDTYQTSAGWQSGLFEVDAESGGSTSAVNISGSNISFGQ